MSFLKIFKRKRLYYGLVLMILVCGLFTNNVFAEEDDNGNDGCPPHDIVVSKGSWEYNSSEHWRWVTSHCRKCGAYRPPYKESDPHSLTTSRSFNNKSQSSCSGTLTKSCNVCDYSSSSSFYNSHSRGSTCSTCGKYYPTHEEEANGYIDKSNKDSEDGEEFQEDAEGNEEDAEDYLEEGDGVYEDAVDEYNNGESALGDAGEENSNSEENLELSDTELEDGISEKQNSDTNMDNSQEYNEDSTNIEDESRLKYGEVEDGQEHAVDKQGETDALLEGNQEKEDDNQDTIDTENTLNESEETGDPVKYTSGEYVSKSTDLKIDNITPAINIIRNYKNFAENSFSFGEGWKFNYDTRIITGIRADYQNYNENLEGLLSEIELIYMEAYVDYQEAMDAAIESKRLAELSVEEADLSVYHANNAKKAAENAKKYADTAGIGAEKAEYYAEEAFRHIRNSREYANNAIDLGKRSENYALEAKNYAEKAKKKAETAISSANSAIHHANQTSKQSLKDRANNTLERAEDLKNRVDNTLLNINGSNGLLEGSNKLQQESQKILDDISANELDKRIEEEIDNARINKETVEIKIRAAEEFYITAEEVYQAALITKNEADKRLAESIIWLEALIENEKVVDNIEEIKNGINALTEQSRLDKEYSETYRYRNKYNVDWSTNPERDEIGIGKLILVDEIGVPHIYEILSEPDFSSELFFPDGKKNYYPDGSETKAMNPIDDKLEIMADGSYLLTKKDGTKYFYSYFGQLTRIEDTNQRYLDFLYNDEHELVKITDTFDREIIIDRSGGRISKITDPLGREHKYSYSDKRLVSYTDSEGNTRRYTYSENGMTATIYPDGNGWNYYYTEVDGRMVVDYQTDASGAIIDFEYNPDTQQTTVRNRRGYERTYIYNDNHLTIEEIDADHRRVYKTYDDNNNLLSITNKRGYTTNYTYDETDFQPYNHIKL